MKIAAIQTEKITAESGSLLALLDRSIGEFHDEAVLAITSKIVSLCEGRAVKTDDIDKQALIEQEAHLFLPPTSSKYHVTLTIKNNLLIANAGIDESNGNGYYVLWPADAQQTANAVREYLCGRFGLARVGVIITDSKTTPLRWGTSGVALAHSGFAALRNYIGAPDIFGKTLRMTKATVMDALAVAAVLVMGEGKEQTPLAIIDDVSFVDFQPRNPTEAELQELQIDLADDLYAAFLQAVPWEKGQDS